MAAHIYLKITGIQGSSKAKGHENEIEVLGWRQRYTYSKVDQGPPKDPGKPPEAGDYTLPEEQPDYEEDLREHQRKSAAYATEKKLFDEGKLDELKSFRQAQRSEHPPLEFSKYVDGASDSLLKASWNGARFSECVFTMYRPFGLGEESGGSVKLTQKNDYLVIKLYDTYISRCILKAPSEKWPTEEFELQYDKAEYTFISGDPKKGEKRTPKRVHWEWKKDLAQKK